MKASSESALDFSFSLLSVLLLVENDSVQLASLISQNDSYVAPATTLCRKRPHGRVASVTTQHNQIQHALRPYQRWQMQEGSRDILSLERSMSAAGGPLEPSHPSVESAAKPATGIASSQTLPSQGSNRIAAQVSHR